MAIIGNVDYDGAVREIGEVQAAAAKLGLNAWSGIGSPKNTPTEVIDKLNKGINTALSDLKIKAQLVPTWAARCLRARPPISGNSS
jgi:hypothetical protein